MSKKFGLHLENNLGASHIDIGSFVPASIFSGKTTVTLTARSDVEHWETQLTGIKFSPDDKDLWGFEDTYVRFDSGVQCMYVPEDDYSWF